MSRAEVTVLAAIALALAGCVSAPDHDPSQWPLSRVELERQIPTDDPAEETYRSHCIACHGVDGRGAGARTGADFTSREGPLTRPDDELLVSILDGRTGDIGTMPAHRGILGEERSRAVLAYVRTHFGADVPIAPAPAPEDGGVDAP
ncbi:MAG: cytochrome c [Sandaracinus sp.]